MRTIMVKIVIFISLLAVGLDVTSCRQKGFVKPKDLISRKKMVDILYDIHMGEAVARRIGDNPPDSVRITSKDIYKAVLDKYNIEDSVLTQSIIYYSSIPKKYDNIYSRVIERMNMEQEEINKQEEIKVVRP